MNKSRKGFSIIEISVIVAILGILLCVSLGTVSKKSEIERQKEKAKPTIEVTDNEILAARRYVIDFDERMKDVNDQINNCVGTDKQLKVIESCTKKAYDSQGWTSGYYSATYIISLSPTLIEEYDTNRRISLKLLSTEI